MIAALLLAAAVAAPLPFDELPPQTLQPQSCAMFLWDRASRQRIIMTTAMPSRLRAVIAGKSVELAAADLGTGARVMGFAARQAYAANDFKVTLDLTITASEAGGAIIRDGIVTIDRPGADSVVAPVAGLIGCSP